MNDWLKSVRVRLGESTHTPHSSSHAIYRKFHSLYYSEVFKARNRKNNALVALKKVRMENETEGVSQSC